MPETIESKLAAALGGVEAPDELWTRVHAALPATAGRGTPGRIWPRFLMAAAVAALISGSVVYLEAQASRHAHVEGASPLAAAAIRLHETGTASWEGNYSVDRRSVSGQAVTLVSEPSPSTPEARKQIRTSETGLLAVSEWIVRGRRWAMVTPKGVHRQACTICHPA
jgi:hypothetical protein